MGVWGVCAGGGSLIHFVTQHLALFDKGNKNYKHDDYKDNVWKNRRMIIDNRQ